MFDTLKWTCAILYYQERIDDLQNLFPDHTTSTNASTKASRTTRFNNWSFPLIGLRLSSTTPSTITRIECELPKIIYGHNGRLIRSNDELTEAVRRIDAILSFLASSTGEPVDGEDAPKIYKGHVARVDLVWQLDFPVHVVRDNLQNARHPRIHSKPDLYGNGNLTFRGKNLTVSIYDKVAECKKGKISPPDCQSVCRVEFQISGKGYVAKMFEVDEAEGLKSFNFEDAYRVYRKLLLGFTDLGNHSCTSSTSLAGFLASEARTDPFIIDRYILSQKLHPSRASALKKEIRSVLLQNFNLAGFVPAPGPTKVVEIKDEKSEERFEAFREANPVFR